MGRSRSRRRRASQRSRSRGARKEDQGDEVQYSIDLLPGRRQDPYPTFDLLVSESDDAQQVVPHVCSRPGEAYVIRVTNSSRRHIACAVTVDGENALLKDGSLIVAPRDARELQGYLVSKNFVGKEYVKEYRDFIFSTPKVIEATKGADDGIPYTTYGRICCEVYEAELDEEVDSDQELRGQTTHYRGAGLHGSNDQRVVPEGKKKHFMYSAVTVQGQRSTIANSTRGRWWVRGPRKLRGEEEPNLTWTSRRCSISAFRIVGGLSVAALVVVAWQRCSSGHRFENFEGFEGRVDGSPSMPLMQKWLPIHQSEVLPYDQWVKAWHVKVGRLTDVVYHTYSSHPEFVKELNGMTTFLQWQLSHNCPKQVVGFDIVSHDAHHFKPLKGVTSPGQCQMICTETQDCNSWTWAKIGPWKYHCWRKNLKGMYRFAENLHTVAGRACDHQTRGYWWPHSDADLYNLPMNLLDKSKVMHWQGRTCAVEGSRHLCQSAMERSFLPWPLNQFQHHGQHVDCCAPVEMQQAAYCSSGTPVRTGKNCSGFEAADFECCPDGHVLRGTKRSEASTMHCVMLFRAWTDEQRLVELQHEQNAGIFACDSYALYSNQLLEIQPGVVTRRIHSPMMCELGGQFITALNLGIFLAFYRQVILDQEFMSAAWVIKVDPDTVWSPSRLRPMLQDLEWGLSGDGIYLNNCKDGLHGPIEIFSSGAFFALGQNAKSCAFHLDGKECIEHCKGVWTQTKVCNGPCTEWWGEDIWADQCLWRFTEAKRVMIKTLLQEEHCKPHVPKWRSCDDPNTVAFHPFKSPEEYRKCLEEMNFHGGLRSLDERLS